MRNTGKPGILRCAASSVLCGLSSFSSRADLAHDSPMTVVPRFLSSSCSRGDVQDAPSRAMGRPPTDCSEPRVRIGVQPPEDRFQFSREHLGFLRCEQFIWACLGGQQATAIDVCLKKISASFRKLKFHLA